MLLNLERAKDKMAKHNLEALVASSSANVLYASDLCPYGQAFALLPLERDVEPAIIAPISGATPVVLMSPPWISDVRYYGEFYINTSEMRDHMTEPERKMVRALKTWKKEKDPITLILAVLKERGITKGKIGVDESSLPSEHSIWRRLKNTLPGLEAVPARDIFRDIRMAKSEKEVERIQEATRITEKAWGTALDQAREGMTEKEFAQIYQQTIISEQGSVMSWMGMYGAPIAFGSRTAFTDVAQPSGYRLRRGDLVRFDGGCRYMGYTCDMARTAVLGQPTDKQRKYYNAILKGEQIAMELAKPGAKPSEIFRRAVRTVREEGIQRYERHHTGHGIGIEEYDPPLIGPNVQTPLEEGMVLCFETPYYEIGWGGPMVEDIVVVGNRPRVLTKSNSDLQII
jgi:Xaa-Pro dipeptidase